MDYDFNFRRDTESYMRLQKIKKKKQNEYELTPELQCRIKVHAALFYQYGHGRSELLYRMMR